MLPKHWGGPAGGGEVAEQLEGKQAGHNGLVRALGDAGALAQLEPLALRCACYDSPGDIPEGCPGGAERAGITDRGQA